MLGGGVILTMRHFRPSLPALSDLKDSLAPSLSSVQVEGAPQVLGGRLQDFLEKSHGSAEQRAQALAREFPCLRSVRVRRDWLKGSARFQVEGRRAVAVVPVKGRAAAYLDDEGVVFPAPEGIYSGLAVSIEPGRAEQARLKELAGYLRSVSRPDVLPSPLRRMSFVSEQEGWEAILEDGTRVLWGELDWTEEKLSRLRDVLRDARTRFGGVLTADLRYFEDGKVLLRLPEKGG
jgi:cell division septal protein FtsQ